ncbi:MAG: serine/threonine protein kinase [Cyanobacteria bacterium HKST-UBA01]|nr:serine/threonine protein kinase [Cyanobacteria bacterium HKST-UBA01]
MNSVFSEEESASFCMHSTELTEEDEEPDGLSSKTAHSIDISEYDILESLGEGGMGEVFRARHKKLGTEYAIKVLRKELLKDNASRKRFELEAKACKSLSSPYIVTTYDSGITPAGVPYIVMEKAEGESLAAILAREGALKTHDFIEIFTRVANALSYAHKASILHRDIKPSNIMVHRDSADSLTVKLLDFGISRFLQDSELSEQQVTKTGELIGSPVYMSPEQCTEGNSDSFKQSSDIYSLGVVMYEALSGAPPFLGGNAIATIMKHLNENPASIKREDGNTEHLNLLEQIIFKCLEKDPGLRYASAAALSVDLDSVRFSKDDYGKKRLLSNCKKARLGRFLYRHGKAAFISLTVTFAVTTLAVQLFADRQQNDRFNKLVATANSLDSLNGDSYEKWMQAYATAKKMGKSNYVQALLLHRAGMARYRNEYEKDPQRFGEGHKEYRQAWNLIKNVGLTTEEKLPILRSLADSMSRSFRIEEPKYYPREFRSRAETLKEKSRAAMDTGKLLEARTLMEKARDLGAQSLNDRILLSNIYSELSMLNAPPNQSLALMEKALCLTDCRIHEKLRFDQLSRFIKASGKDPQSFNTRLLLSREAEARGDLAAAALELHAALALQNNETLRKHLVELQNKLANQRYRLADRTSMKAVPHLKKLIKFENEVFKSVPYPAQFHCRDLAKIYLENGFYEDAQKYFALSDIEEQMLYQTYRDPIFDQYLGTLYMTGRFDKLISLMDKCKENLIEKNRKYSISLNEETIFDVAMRAKIHMLRNENDQFKTLEPEILRSTWHGGRPETILENEPLTYNKQQLESENFGDTFTSEAIGP